MSEDHNHACSHAPQCPYYSYEAGRTSATLESIQEGIDRIEENLPKIEERLRKLETFRSWATGMGTAISSGIALKLFWR